MHLWITIVSSTLSEQMFSSGTNDEGQNFQTSQKNSKMIIRSSVTCRVQNAIDKLLVNYEIGKSIDHNHAHKPSILDSD